MCQGECLPVLLGLTYEGFKAQLQELEGLAPRDREMLVRVSGIVMVTKDREANFTDTVSFAAVQKLMLCELPRLADSRSAADLAFVLRLKEAVAWMAHHTHMPQLKKDDVVELTTWPSRLLETSDKLAHQVIPI